MYTDAFISHSSRDQRRAQTICALLEKKGLSCWIAPRDVRPGRDYAIEILDGIENAAAFVVTLSESANESEFVKREVERAANWRKPIICVRLSNVMPARALELFLSTTHWIDAFGPVDDRGRYDIVRAVRAAGGGPSHLSADASRSVHPTAKSVHSFPSMLKWRLGQARRALNRFADLEFAAKLFGRRDVRFQALAFLPHDTRFSFRGLKIERSDIERGVTLGRGDDAGQYQINHPTISRRHLEMISTSRGIRITDLGSTNGTFINQMRLKPHTQYRFSIGDRLRIGGLDVSVYPS